MARTGRPKTDEPRRNNIMVRLTDKEFQRLKESARKNNLTITGTVRKGIEKLLDSET